MLRNKFFRFKNNLVTYSSGWMRAVHDGSGWCCMRDSDALKADAVVEQGHTRTTIDATIVGSIPTCPQGIESRHSICYA